LALKDIAARSDVEIVYPVHLNPNVQKPVREILCEVKNVHLIDPAQLGDREAFMAEAEAYLEWLRQSPVAEGDHLLLPGEPERLARKQSRLHGIRLDTATWNEITTAGERLGLPRAECEDLARRER
jgi:LDH2 family malate/lactate/ureidoglycolate dehydrogenase